MLNMLISFLFMFFLFIILFFFSLFMLFSNYMMLIEWSFFSFNSMSFELVVLLDWVSMLFMGVVLFISSLIMLYSISYMKSDIYLIRFWYLVLFFVISMLLMIMSPSIISILFGWDGLGVVSYCLVIYYQNYSSYNSGMVTILINRLGDIGLLMSISILMISGSWNLWLYDSCPIIVIVMLMLAALSKSAQIPFSVWLPLAMSAPTPVSALVHSSTLVTAGVYLLIRYNMFLLTLNMVDLLMFLSVMTMFLSGFVALVVFDLKKIIALSTLSQLGLMMMTLSMGLESMSFFHLLIHAIFKSMLFMSAGIIIHSLKNFQDIRLIGGLCEVSPYVMLNFLVSMLALCGFPFMSGFYSKDLIIEICYIYHMNIFMLFLILLSLLMTVLYSVRLFYYIFYMNLKFNMFFFEDKLMNISIFLLMLLSSFIGSLLGWLIFFDINYIFVSFSLKVFILLFCFFGLMLSYLLNKLFIRKMKVYYFQYYLGMMLYLGVFQAEACSLFNIMGSDLIKFDNSWLELFSKYNFFSLILSDKMMLKIINYKLSMFIAIFILFIILLLLVY